MVGELQLPVQSVPITTKVVYMYFNRVIISL